MIKKTYSFKTNPRKLKSKASFIFSESFALLLSGAKKQSCSCAYYVNYQVLQSASAYPDSVIDIQTEVDGNNLVVTYTTRENKIESSVLDSCLELFIRVKCKTAGMNGKHFLTFFIPLNMALEEEVKIARNLYNSYINETKKSDALKNISIEMDAAGAKAYDEIKHISFLIRRLTVPVHDEYMAQVEVFDHNGIVYQLLVNKIDLDEFRHSDEAQAKYGKDIHGINYIAMLDNLYKNVIKKYCESAT